MQHFRKMAKNPTQLCSPAKNTSSNFVNNMDKQNINHSCKDFVEKPLFWLKKLELKWTQIDLHKAWFSLIQTIEEKNLDLVPNLVFILKKLVNDDYTKKLFPLNVFCQFGDLPLIKFIIENNMVETLSRRSKYGNTPIHSAVAKGYTEIVKALVRYVFYINYQ